MRKHKIFFLKKNQINSSITNRLLSNIYFLYIYIPSTNNFANEIAIGYKLK